MHLNLNPDPNPTFKRSPIVTTKSSSPEPITLAPASVQSPDPNLTFSFAFNPETPPVLKPEKSPRPSSPPPTPKTTTPNTTTYHIYPSYPNPNHSLITQHTLPKSSSKRRKYLKQNPDLLSSPITTPNPPSPSKPPSPFSSSTRSETYYLHLPTLSFRSPPRTLHRGPTKSNPPICIIHNSTFWKRWRILTGPELLNAIDPRGLLRWEKRSTISNKPALDTEIKGYRVRSWRCCGESGKGYFKDVNRRRTARRREGVRGMDEEEEKWDPVRADELLPLTWLHATPLSTRVRWYAFTYAGVDAIWKGSREIPARKKWSRRLMPVNHLKLVVGGSGSSGKHGLGSEKGGEGGDAGEEIVLARYSSSLSMGKQGTLVIFDEEVRRVFWGRDLIREEVGGLDEYDVIVATAMCMVLGEWQKRKTVREILLALAAAGADGGSAVA